MPDINIDSPDKTRPTGDFRIVNPDKGFIFYTNGKIQLELILTLR
jgi:hypothetical protein